jgi:hypothetical protein
MSEPTAERISVRGDASHDTVARLATQRSKFRAAAKNLTTERDQLRAEVTKLKGEVLEAAKTGGAARIAELEGQLRDQSHRGKFNELAKAAGVKANALDDLWERSGYKAEGDQPDEGKIASAIAKQKTDRDYLFEAATDPAEGAEGQEGPDTPPGSGERSRTEPKPGPGRGQGGNQRATGGQFQATDAQLRDPAWCFANAAKLSQVANEVANLPNAQVSSKLAIL